MTNELKIDDRLNKEIIDEVYQWAKNLEEDALFDLLLSKSAAFILTNIFESTIIIASEIKGIEKVIREKYTEKETKNILINAIVFGEKVVTAVKTSVIADEHVLLNEDDYNKN